MIDMLKPQDIFVMLKLVSIGIRPWTYAGLAVDVGMSPSQLHSSIKRSLAAQLSVREGERIVPHFRNLAEFLLHGLKYVFWAERGALTRGMPTAYAAPPLAQQIVADDTEPPPVWPDPEGEERGISFQPLYKMAPRAARSDSNLYELLALVDALRSGRSRERQIAEQEMKKRLEQYAARH